MGDDVKEVVVVQRDELLDQEKARHAAWFESIKPGNGGVPIAHADRRLRGLVLLPTKEGIRQIEEQIAKKRRVVRLLNTRVAKAATMRDCMSVEGDGRKWPATLVRIGHVEPRFGSHQLVYPTNFDFRRPSLPEFSHFIPRELHISVDDDPFGPTFAGHSWGTAFPSDYLLALNELNEAMTNAAVNGFVGGKPLCPAYRKAHKGSARQDLSSTPSFRLLSGFRIFGDGGEGNPESIFNHVVTSSLERHEVTCPECQRTYALRHLKKLKGFQIFEDGNFTFECRCERVTRCDMERDVVSSEPKINVPEWLQRKMLSAALKGLPLKAPADLTVNGVMLDEEMGCKFVFCVLSGTDGYWFHFGVPKHVEVKEGEYKRGDVICRVFHEATDDHIRVRDGVFGGPPSMLATTNGIKEGFADPSLAVRWDALRQLCDPVPEATRKLRAGLYGKFHAAERKLAEAQHNLRTKEMTKEVEAKARFNLKRLERQHNLLRDKLEDLTPDSPFFTMLQKSWFDLYGQIEIVDGVPVAFYREEEVEQSKSQIVPDELLWEFEVTDFKRDANAVVCQPMPTTQEDAAAEAIGYLNVESLSSPRFVIPKRKRKNTTKSSLPAPKKGKGRSGKKKKKTRRRKSQTATTK
jgi:hypothetical protein